MYECRWSVNILLISSVEWRHRVRLPGQVMVVMQVMPQPLVGPSGQPTPPGLLPGHCHCHCGPGPGWAGSRSVVPPQRCQEEWQCGPACQVMSPVAAARDYWPGHSTLSSVLLQHTVRLHSCVAYTVGFLLHPPSPCVGDERQDPECWCGPWAPCPTQPVVTGVSYNSVRRVTVWTLQQGHNDQESPAAVSVQVVSHD